MSFFLCGASLLLSTSHFLRRTSLRTVPIGDGRNSMPMMFARGEGHGYTASREAASDVFTLHDMRPISCLHVFMDPFRAAQTI